MRRSKGRAGEALLEGPHLVEEALDAGVEPSIVLATPEFSESAAGRHLAARLKRPPLLAEANLLAEVSDSDSPRGIVAVGRIPVKGTSDLPVLAGATYIYLDGVQDPGNLGALARVAEAAGAAALVISAGSAHPHHPRALRASAGSLLRLPVAQDASVGALEEHLQAIDPSWAALVPRGGEDLYQAELEGTTVLALGAEGPGLSPPTLRRVRRRLTIPMAAPVESLNVTVAAALVLFEIRRRRPAS